ncbi:MAG TPA: ThiF family adenylyltransferase [Planctomycetota bacterium]|nr:ThiF family adenylyltransferase [Planctomycetota bacterium]
MNQQPRPEISLAEGRFARFNAISWWDQSLLRNARILVVGAGALGNEVIKNLALLGAGNIAIVDMDLIEESNLSRSVLFRLADEGQPKAATAARAVRELYPDINAVAIVGNVLSDVGLGWFRWADVVVGALDNREARVFVNRCCALTGRAWVDGGIDVLSGIVRMFRPPETACYECTMGQADWDQLAKRRSCSLLARRAFREGGTPTTPTTASVIGAMQAQEVVKYIHGLPCLAGKGFVFEGAGHTSYPVEYQVSPDCPWHEAAAPIEPAPELGGQARLSEICTWAAERLGCECGVSLDLAREIVERLDCPKCGESARVLLPAERVSEKDAICPKCGSERVPQFVHTIPPDSPLLELTVAGIGLPEWDIVWARHGEKCVGIEVGKGGRNEE